MILFSPRYRVQTGSGAHPTIYPVGTGGGEGSPFPEGKATEARTDSMEQSPP
jgi:hypothetical protein